MELDLVNLRSVKPGKLTQETMRDAVKEGQRIIPLGPGDLRLLFKDNWDLDPAKLLKSKERKPTS